MGQKDKKKESTGSDNSDVFLQVPGTQITDDGDIPLVLINNGATPGEVRERKRSRAISKVSMTSDDGAEESGKVS